jgi:hypothetical protein
MAYGEVWCVPKQCMPTPLPTLQTSYERNKPLISDIGTLDI